MYAVAVRHPVTGATVYLGHSPRRPWIGSLTGARLFHHPLTAALEFDHAADTVDPFPDTDSYQVECIMVVD